MFPRHVLMGCRKVMCVVCTSFSLSASFCHFLDFSYHLANKRLKHAPAALDTTVDLFDYRILFILPGMGLTHEESLTGLVNMSSQLDQIYKKKSRMFRSM